MPQYFPNVEYGTRLVTHRGLGSLRSARATRRRRRLLGQDDTNYLPSDISIAPIDVASPISFPDPGTVAVADSSPSGSLDSSSYYASLGIPTVGGQPAISAIGSGPSSGVTYTSTPTSSVGSFLSTPNSVLGVSNGLLLAGAALIALLATMGGSR